MAGEGAGDLHLYVYFETMSQAMAVGEAMTGDAGVKALMAEREANPAGEVIGPEGFGHQWRNKGDTRASLQRVYEMKRSNLPAAMEMLEELRVMMKDEPVNIFAGVPVIASKMDMLFVSYAFVDLAALGAGVDGVGISPEFQASWHASEITGVKTDHRRNRPTGAMTCHKRHRGPAPIVRGAAFSYLKLANEMRAGRQMEREWA